MAVLDASDEDLEAIRKCLRARWPYPLTQDGRIKFEDDEEEEEGGEKTDGEKKEIEKKEETEEKKEGEEKAEEKKDDEKEATEKKEEEEQKDDNKKEEEAPKEEEEKKQEKTPQQLQQEQAKLLVQPWLFKVKRYPWAVSYGNKHLDTLIEAVKVVAARKDIKLPSPKNMDAESAKSLLVFLLKVRSFHKFTNF